MGTLKYKGYSGTVEYSEEDNCLFGKVIGMNKNIITYEGKTVEELKADLNPELIYILKVARNGK